jgi:hypothetical protein
LVTACSEKSPFPSDRRLLQMAANSIQGFRHIRLGRSQVRERRPIDLNQTLHEVRRARSERSLMLHDGIQHPREVAGYSRPLNVTPILWPELDCIQYSHTKFQKPRMVDDHSLRYSKELLGPVRYSTCMAFVSSAWVNPFQFSATAHSKMRSMLVLPWTERLTSIPSSVRNSVCDAAICP